MLIAALMGLIQGLTEWLPVSSQGVIATTYLFAKNVSIDEAVLFSFWLHLGTVISVIIVFRREIVVILVSVIRRPTRPTPITRFLVVSTVVSGVVSLPFLVITLGDVSKLGGAMAMMLVGIMMVANGVIQMRRGWSGVRDKDSVSLKDAFIVGVAQGIAVVPGISRSGVTVAALLVRKIDRRDALLLSFLMSMPVSLAAGIYAGLDSGLFWSKEAMVALGVAAIVGLLAIRLFLTLAGRFDFSKFVVAAGTLVLVGAIWEVLR